MLNRDAEVALKLERLKKLLDEHPSDAQAWLDYSRCLHNTKCGSPLETVEALQRAADLLPDIDLRMRIGDALVDVGRVKEGLREMYEYLADHPKAFSYRILARDLINVGKYRRARKVLRRALTIDFRNAETLYLMGRLIESKSKPCSILYFRKAVEFDAHHQPAWRELGYRLIENENTRSEGLDALKTAVALDPSDRWSRVGLALGFGLAGQSEESEFCYREAAELFPTDDYISACLAESQSHKSPTFLGEGNRGKQTGARLGKGDFPR